MTAILKVDTIQDTSGNNIINENANTVTIGKSGDTVNVIGTLQNGGTNFLQGITMADQWRNTTDLTADADPITTLERVDETSSGTIGTGMTESSGEFTFPTTGIYFITIKAGFLADGDTNIGVYTYVDTGSGYDLYDVVEAGSQTGVTRCYGYGSLILDVTNTSTHKIKFSAVGMSAGNIIFGNTNYNRTAFTFIRLGDT